MNGKTYKEMLKERIEAQMRWSSSHLSKQQREEMVARLLEDALAPTPAAAPPQPHEPDVLAEQAWEKATE
ncbi:MAG: hypothetical protein LAN64_14265 [Acidobacteriia bacterium]|nr:hypothetical protein [Terriglobia bacterium]